MSTMDKRVARLEVEVAARKPAERRIIRLIAQADGETTEQAVARWEAEHPGEAAVDEEHDFIILRSIVSPNSKEERK
jgi:hypothetical protein